MSIVRVQDGYQARAYVAPGRKLTKFVSDRANGGMGPAWQAAEQVEKKLKAKAKRIRRKA